MNDVTRIRHRRINLCLALSKSVQIGTTALLIITKESLIVIKVCLRGNSFIINALPILRRHLTLNNVKVLTKSRQALAILTLSQTEHIHSLKTTLTSIMAVRRSTIKPLRHKANGLALLHISHIFLPLLTNQFTNNRLSNGIIHDSIDIIPTGILRNHGNQVRHNLSTTIVHHILKANLEETALTLTLTDIASIEQPTNSETRILRISCTELLHNIAVGKATKSRDGSVDVKKSRTRGLIGNSTIRSVLLISRKRRNCNLSVVTLSSILNLVHERSLTANSVGLSNRLLRLRSPSLSVILLVRIVVVIHNFLLF